MGLSYGLPHIDQALEDLHLRYRENRLVYLVGAGASIASGLPGWDELNINILQAHLHSLDGLQFASGEPTVLRRVATVFSERFGRDAVVDLVRQQLRRQIRRKFAAEGSVTVVEEQVRKQFDELLHQALYQTPHPEDLKPIHRELAASVRNGSERGAMGLYTFNYDDLLERAYEEVHGVAPHSCTSGEQQSPFVVHLHGYRPRSGEGQGRLVLSELDYYATEERWASRELERLLQDARDGTKTLLLVGVSLTDPRLRRFLHSSLQTAASRRAGGVYVMLTERTVEEADGGGEDFISRFGNRMANAYQRDYWESWQANVIPVVNHEYLPDMLRRVRLGSDVGRIVNYARETLAADGFYQNLYSKNVQRAYSETLADWLTYIQYKFALTREEEIHAGIFVPTSDDEPKLVLAAHYCPEPGKMRWPTGHGDLGNYLTKDVARSNGIMVSSEGQQGLTGHAFAYDVPVQGKMGDPLLHLNFPTPVVSQHFSALFSIPVRYTRGAKVPHIPVGVIYLSSNRRLPFWERLSCEQCIEFIDSAETAALEILRSSKA